jgi:BirA family biotin operon repressor/biotin-[acetyl-CoA-carboxylase] ligase
LADAFDHGRFDTRLAGARLGRPLLVRERTASTNDDAWDALVTHGDGAAVLALEQTRGRGRAGRSWAQAPGRGLALSVALRWTGDPRQAGVIPLAAGLAVVRACHALGVPEARLKWPNDVRVGARKLAGVLCEMRRGPGGGDAVVIGVGLNVRTREADFPPELRGAATSLAREGADVALEDAAAEVLVQLEPLWEAVLGGDGAPVLAEWARWCPDWGRRVSVRTPAGRLEGVARRLDPQGGLVLDSERGQETTVVAGDVESPAGGGDTA